MLGSAVCRMHGGAAPQVREAARQRLLELVAPALATLARGVKNRKGVPFPTEIAAAREILNRAGIPDPTVAVDGGASITLVVRSVLQPAEEVEA